MPEMNGAGNTRTILIDPATNCMYTNDPATGQLVLITDPTSGMPLANRVLNIDAASGCYFVTDSATGKASWVIDPISGRPMVGAVPPAPVELPAQGQLSNQAQPGGSPQAAGQAFGQPASSAQPATVVQQPSAQQQSFSAPAGMNGQATQQGHFEKGPVPVQSDPLSNQPASAPSSQAAPEKPIVSTDPYANHDLQAGSAAAQSATSGMAVTALVVGLVAIATSFLPIINNGSFVLAILGAIFAIVGIVGTGAGKKKGRGMAVAGLLLGVAAIGITLATQSLYGAYVENVLDQIQHGTSPVAVSPADGESTGTTGPDAAPGNGQGGTAAPGGTGAPQGDYGAMKPGQTATFANGLSVTVNSVKLVKKSYDNSTMTEVNVSYANAGSSNEAFNLFDWRAEDKNGAIRSVTAYSGDNPLSSGQLSAGGTVTGNVYFDGAVAKVYYYNNVLQSDSNVCWIVE